MFEIVKTEIKKAFFQKSTMAVLLFLLLISWKQAYTAVQGGLQILNSQVSGNPQITSSSAFIRWLGADTSTFESTVFFFLFPLFAALPYGWSLAEELRSGYISQIIVRNGRRNYFFAKFLAVFLSGSLVIIIPLVINFMTVSMYLPALKPELLYPYGGLLQRSVWSGIYYTYPHIYVLLYILLDGIFGGIFAVICTAAAFFLKHPTMTVMVPFCLYTVLEYLDSNFAVMTGIGYDTSPAKYLRAMAMANEHGAWIICIEAVVLFGISAGLNIRKGKRYEVL